MHVRSSPHFDCMGRQIPQEPPALLTGNVSPSVAVQGGEQILNLGVRENADTSQPHTRVLCIIAVTLGHANLILEA